MPKTDNPHAVRLFNSLIKHADETTAERIANKIPLSKSADFEKKFKWAKSVCADLEEAFNDAEIRKIRMACSCATEMGKFNSLKKLWQSSADIADFAERAGGLNHGFTLLWESQSLYLIYPQCYCSCVKRVDEPLPAAWCYCTLGYAKTAFEYVFEREVAVELIESVKLGDGRCKIRIA